jgi:hypothetical protein
MGVMLYRLRIGKGVRALVAGESAVLHSSRPVLTAAEMISQFGIVFRQTITKKFLDRCADRPVQLPAASHQEAIVCDVLDYGVLEDVGRFRVHPELIDNLQRFQLAQ